MRLAQHWEKRGEDREKEYEFKRLVSDALRLVEWWWLEMCRFSRELSPQCARVVSPHFHHSLHASTHTNWWRIDSHASENHMLDSGTTTEISRISLDRCNLYLSFSLPKHTAPQIAQQCSNWQYSFFFCCFSCRCCFVIVLICLLVVVTWWWFIYLNNWPSSIFDPCECVRRHHQCELDRIKHRSNVPTVAH